MRLRQLFVFRRTIRRLEVILAHQRGRVENTPRRPSIRLPHCGTFCGGTLSICMPHLADQCPRISWKARPACSRSAKRDAHFSIKDFTWLIAYFALPINPGPWPMRFVTSTLLRPWSSVPHNRRQPEPLLKIENLTEMKLP